MGSGTWANVPTQEVVVLTLRDLCQRGTDGNYVVLYDGDGWLDFSMDATVLSRRKGRIEIRVELTCDSSCWFDSSGWSAYCTDNGISVRWYDSDVTWFLNFLFFPFFSCAIIVLPLVLK